MAGATPNQPAPSPTPLVVKRDAAKVAEVTWTLSYMQRSAIKTTLMNLPSSMGIDEAVEIAKRYCKKRAVTFSWLEPAYADLEGIL